MTEQADPQSEQLRAALRSVAADTPSNRMARQSIVAGVAQIPAMYAVAMEELAHPQAELAMDLIDGPTDSHTTRADWLGRFVARLSSAVNEVTKSMVGKKRLTPSLQIFAPTHGSVRVIVRVPSASAVPSQGSIQGADDTTAESRALSLVTALWKMSADHDPGVESPLTAATQTLSPRARQMVRATARSVMDAGWEIEATLTQRGKTLETLHLDPASAERLYQELDREVVQRVTETLEGSIDGQRHSLSTMWFVPTGSNQPFEVAVTDFDLLQKVTRFSAVTDLRVECHFNVFLSFPAGSTEAASRSRELESITALEPDPTL